MSHHKVEHDADDAVMVKLIATASGVAATFLANTIIRQVWKHFTGSSAPKHWDDPNLKIAQAVGFAALSAGVAVLVKRLVTHGATEAMRRVGKETTAELASHIVAQHVNKGH